MEKIAEKSCESAYKKREEKSLKTIIMAPNKKNFRLYSYCGKGWHYSIVIAFYNVGIVIYFTKSIYKSRKKSIVIIVQRITKLLKSN